MGAASSAKRQRQSSQVAGLRRLVAAPIEDFRFSRPLIRLGSSPAVSDRGASMAAISSSLHHGSVVLLGEDVTSPTRAKVAIKVQSILTESVAKLDVEAAVYAAVDDPRGHQFCPRLHYAGSNDEFKLLVLEMLGPNLEDVFNLCNKGRRPSDRSFSLETISVLAIEALHCLKQLHRAGFVHNDVRPQNFVMSRNYRRTELYMIGFGHAKRFIDPNTRRHIVQGRMPVQPEVVQSSFCPLESYDGQTVGRRSDMEALGYVLLYFARGTLPWDAATPTSPLADTGSSIRNPGVARRMKQDTSVDELCAGLPTQLAAYLSYVRGLAFDEQPDYKLCQDLFLSLIAESGFSLSTVPCDWMVLGAPGSKTPRR